MKKLSEKKDVSDRLVNATILVTLSGWAIQVLGLVSTLILARLLTPHDYGVVASATLFVAFLQTTTEMSAGNYIKKKQTITTSDIDNAWSIKVVQRLLISVVLLLSAQYIGEYFDSKEVEFAVYFLSLSNFIATFSNNSFLIDNRELKFKVASILSVSSKIATVIVTVSMAFIVQDYRAFLYGLLAGSITTLIMSYSFGLYRPKFNFKGASAQLHFSKWMLLNNISTYIRNKIDQFMVSSAYSIEDLGRYNMADTLASLAVQQLSSPISTSSHSALSGVNNNMSKFLFLFNRVVGTIYYVTVPIIVFAFVYWAPVVDVILGDNWSSLHDFGFLFLFMALTWTFIGLNQNIMIITGFERFNAYFSWAQALFLVPILYFAIQYELVYFVFIKLIILISFMLSYAIWLRYKLGISLMIYLKRLYRILILSLLSLVPGLFIFEASGFITLSIHAATYFITLGGMVYLIRQGSVFRCEIEDYLINNTVNRLKIYFIKS